MKLIYRTYLKPFPTFPVAEIQSVTVLSRGSEAALDWGEEVRTHDIILMKNKSLALNARLSL